jgi:hypothetical protein
MFFQGFPISRSLARRNNASPDAEAEWARPLVRLVNKEGTIKFSFVSLQHMRHTVLLAPLLLVETRDQIPI